MNEPRPTPGRPLLAYQLVQPVRAYLRRRDLIYVPPILRGNEIDRAPNLRILQDFSGRRLITRRRMIVEESPHDSFGHDLVGQIWTKDL